MNCGEVQIEVGSIRNTLSQLNLLATCQGEGEQVSERLKATWIAASCLGATYISAYSSCLIAMGLGTPREESEHEVASLVTFQSRWE